MISRLNFNIIDTHDFKTIGIVDTSWYNPEIVIEEATIEILPPGYANAVSPFYMTKALNIFNSNSLGITKASCEDELVDLPDGLWKVKYSICPGDKLFIEKFFLRTDKLRCRFNQAFLSLDLKNECAENKLQRKRLFEIEFYIQGAIAASNDQNAKDAHDFYRKADKLLTNYLTDKGICGC